MTGRPMHKVIETRWDFGALAAPIGEVCPEEHAIGAAGITFQVLLIGFAAHLAVP